MSNNALGWCFSILKGFCSTDFPITSMCLYITFHSALSQNQSTFSGHMIHRSLPFYYCSASVTCPQTISSLISITNLSIIQLLRFYNNVQFFWSLVDMQSWSLRWRDEYEDAVQACTWKWQRSAATRSTTRNAFTSTCLCQSFLMFKVPCCTKWITPLI